MGCRVVVAVVAAGCGRIGFGELHDAPGTPCAFVSLVGGGAHTCGLDAAGSVWCWGGNDTGQAVPGAGPVALEPMRIALPMAAVEIAAGRQSSCARLLDGTVRCWGDNTFGQLGDGDTMPVTAPVAVALGGERALEIGVGAYHACIRRASDLAIACGGNDKFFALGDPSGTMSPTPLPIAGTAGSKRLAMGHRHNCAIDAQDRVVCWGRDRHGQLGDLAGDSATPKVIAGISGALAVGAAGGYSCGVVQGEVRCWGRGGDGQLGSVDSDSTAPSAPIVTGAIDVKMTAFGPCALGADGSVACWGSAAFGDGTAGYSSTVHTARVSGVTQLTAGYFHTCAMTPAGPVCWGANELGELGRGTRSVTADPVAIALPQPPDALASGGFQTCARAGNRVFCWGDNSDGQLGDGTTLDPASPVEAATGLATVDGVTLMGSTTCAWGGGTARCWGRGAEGELGNGSSPHRQLVPVAVSAGSVT